MYFFLVRTVIELVKNNIHYNTQYSKLIGPLDTALRETCNNNRFSELYELVALANVLKCEVQSVYPYINYRAEMKIMNAVYKPIDVSVPNNRRLIIFWTNTNDEFSVKSRSGCGGVWSPNHFVPLIQPCRSHRTTSVEQTHMMPEVVY